jgi:predicted RNase H-like HicB family nuclease
VAASYSAVIQQDGEWWMGWGVSSQSRTREELLENLYDVLDEALRAGHGSRR